MGCLETFPKSLCSCIALYSRCGLKGLQDRCFGIRNALYDHVDRGPFGFSCAGNCAGMCRLMQALDHRSLSQASDNSRAPQWVSTGCHLLLHTRRKVKPKPKLTYYNILQYTIIYYNIL